jgi:hypothetical protein
VRLVCTVPGCGWSVVGTRNMSLRHAQAHGGKLCHFQPWSPEQILERNRARHRDSMARLRAKAKARVSR